MEINTKENKFISYVIILITLFVLILFTKPIIWDIFTNKDLLETKHQELVQQENNLRKLQQIKKDVEINKNLVKRFDKWFTESELIDYFYNYTEESKTLSWSVTIKSITLTQASKNELGFYEQSINLNVVITSESALIRMLDFLVSDNSKYQFFIDSFTYPKNIRWNNINMSIPLKIFFSSK